MVTSSPPTPLTITIEYKPYTSYQICFQFRFVRFLWLQQGYCMFKWLISEAYLTPHQKLRIGDAMAKAIPGTRHDPEIDGCIIMGRVDCTEEVDLCRSYMQSH
ncbi:unnamed protein product [Lactuca virosa]|uniref:Uncharacterized protein n=1 Tax=Lactuca virosa TaxID=75947 RepID=A0AAU9N797_9ASTR|nr:unnamed protein product [Lactuca virosa]